MRNGKIRIGIMGLGQIGRHLYHLALENDDIEIVAVADIGKPEIIEYLLKSEIKNELPCQLRDNYLVNDKFRTRMFQHARPEESAWRCSVSVPLRQWCPARSWQARRRPWRRSPRRDRAAFAGGLAARCWPCRSA